MTVTNQIDRRKLIVSGAIGSSWKAAGPEQRSISITGDQLS
jgi:hypothetical protein